MAYPVAHLNTESVWRQWSMRPWLPCSPSLFDLSPCQCRSRDNQGFSRAPSEDISLVGKLLKTCKWFHLQASRGCKYLCNGSGVVVVVAFSLLARILGECSTIYSLPALFFFFYKLRLACAHKFNFLKDQSTVAQWPEMTVAEFSLLSFVWAGVLIGSHTMPGQWRSQPTLTLLGQGYMCV